MPWNDGVYCVELNKNIYFKTPFYPCRTGMLRKLSLQIYTSKKNALRRLSQGCIAVTFSRRAPDVRPEHSCRFFFPFFFFFCCLRQDMAFFEATTSGKLTSRLSSDVNAMVSQITPSLNILFNDRLFSLFVCPPFLSLSIYLSLPSTTKKKRARNKKGMRYKQKSFFNVMCGKNAMSAQMLEAFLLGVTTGTPSRRRGAWSND